MFVKLSELLFLLIVSENTLLGSLLEDFNRDESPREIFSATDFLKQAMREVEETAELGKDALKMLEEQGEMLAKVENCHDNELVPSLNQTDIILHNLSRGVKEIFFGNAKFSKERTLRILEKNEEYAYVKTWKFPKGWMWEERIIGLKHKNLIVYGKILQHNYAKVIPLEKASLREIKNSESNDRQFGVEVSYERKNISFFFSNKKTMSEWRKKLTNYISLKGNKQKVSRLEKKSKFNDGFTDEDHRVLDQIHNSLDGILEISKTIGETVDSQTRQIGRISGGVGNSLKTIENQKNRLRKIHNRF